MRRLTLLLLALLAAPLALHAQGEDRISPEQAPYAYAQLSDKGAETAAASLMETIRCIQCQGQSIADSDAPIAAAMRNEIRQQIESGKSPDEVREWLIDRYGDWVSYDPSFNWVSAPLYFVPVLLLLLGGFVAWRRFSARKDLESES